MHFKITKFIRTIKTYNMARLQCHYLNLTASAEEGGALGLLNLRGLLHWGQPTLACFFICPFLFKITSKNL